MATYYVSNSGNNADSGSSGSPWETIAYALTQISRGDTLRLNRGDKFEEAVTVAIANSGTTRITFEDHGTGAKPIISAGVTASGWVNTGGNIWTYENASFVEVTQVKIGGSFQKKGTFPNSGFYFPTSYLGKTSFTDTVNLAGKDFTGGELVTRKERWVLDRQPITGHSGSTLTVTAVGSNFNGNGYFIQNHPDCCTQEGDWAFVASEDKVYLYSTVDPNTLDIEISLHKNALFLDNSDYLTFINIDFQLGYEDNIFREFSTDIVFNGCESKFAGRNGMQGFVSPRCTWEFGLMQHIGNTGIMERDTGGSGIADSIFRNSKFEDIGAVAGYGLSGTAAMMGIFVNNTEDGTQVTDNYFNRVGNIAVRVSSENCDVDRNYVNQASYLVGDAAAYYTFNSATNLSSFTRNIAINTRANNTGFLEVKNDGCGFYLDDNTDEVSLLENYAYDCDYLYYLHNCENCTVEDNYGIVGEAGFRVSDDESQGAFPSTIRVRNNSVQRNTISIDAGKKVTSMRTIAAYEFSDPWLYGTFAANKYHRVDTESYLTDIPGTAGFLQDRDFADYQTYTGLDSTSTEETFDRATIQAVLNDSFDTNTIPLTGTWKDFDNNYYRGEIELGPMESAILFFVADPDPKIGTELFFEDWESGNTTHWDIDGEVNTSYIPATADSTVSTDQARSGIYSLKMVSENDLGQTNNFRYAEPNDNDDFIATFHLYFPAKIDLANNFDSFFNLIQTKGVNLTGDFRNDPIWVLGLGVRGGKGTGGDNYLTLGYLGQFWPELGVPQEVQTPLVTLDIPIAEWFKVQIRYLKSEDNGVVQVWQNDTLLFEKRQGITFPDSLVDNLFMSVNNYGEERLPSGAGNETTVYVDDVSVNLLSGSYDFGDYTLTVTAGTGGNATQSPEGIHGEGDTVTLTATPDSGYEFAGWYDGATLLSTDNPYSYTMPAENKTIEAQFTLLPTEFTLTLAIDPAGAGNATQSPLGPHESGTEVTLTAIPNPSYVFLGWYDGETDLSTDNPYLYTTTGENKTLTAKFQINLSGPFIKKAKWGVKSIV